MYKKYVDRFMHGISFSRSSAFVVFDLFSAHGRSTIQRLKLKDFKSVAKNLRGRSNICIFYFLHDICIPDRYSCEATPNLNHKSNISLSIRYGILTSILPYMLSTTSICPCILNIFWYSNLNEIVTIKFFHRLILC